MCPKCARFLLLLPLLTPSLVTGVTHSLPLFASWVATVLCCLVAYIVLAFNIIQTRLRVMMTLIFFIFLGMFYHRTGRDTKRWPRTTANETKDPGIACPTPKNLPLFRCWMWFKKKFQWIDLIFASTTITVSMMQRWRIHMKNVFFRFCVAMVVTTIVTLINNPMDVLSTDR